MIFMSTFTKSPLAEITKCHINGFLSVFVQKFRSQVLFKVRIIPTEIFMWDSQLRINLKVSITQNRFPRVPLNWLLGKHQVSHRHYDGNSLELQFLRQDFNAATPSADRRLWKSDNWRISNADRLSEPIKGFFSRLFPMTFILKRLSLKRPLKSHRWMKSAQSMGNSSCDFPNFATQAKFWKLFEKWLFVLGRL